MFGSGLAGSLGGDAGVTGGVKVFIMTLEPVPGLDVPQCVQKEAVSFTFSPQAGQTQYFSGGADGTGGVCGTVVVCGSG